MDNQNGLEPMQVDIPFEEYNIKQNHCIVENPTFDLETYANSYSGLARIFRLDFIADHCPTMRAEALKLAIQEVLRTYNTSMYQYLCKKLADCYSSNLPDIAAGGGQDTLIMDLSWIDSKNKKAALKLEKLDSDLKTYKSSSIKESIRRGHDDLGDHYLECGDLNNALKCYSRSRDYCTNGKHIINLCTNVVKVAVYLKNWSHVLSCVTKAETTPEYIELKEVNLNMICRLKCAAGLAELCVGRYKAAAKWFLQLNFDFCDFPDLMSLNNIAIYGGLCALATFDRTELQKNVILSSSFKLFLELEPQIRDIIFKFYDSNYASCLSMLNEIKDNLCLDMYLSEHVENIYAQIRDRAIIQYFTPYLSVDMYRMAQALNTCVNDLEDEIIKLILGGQMQARIDSHNKILYVKDTDYESKTFDKALMVGKFFKRSTKFLVLRAAIMNRHIQVKKS